MTLTQFTQNEYLSILTHAPVEAIKALAEAVIPQVKPITVLNNRTGLVMLPYIDSAQGTAFHLGEVLVAEGHVRLESSVEGYGMIVGRDLTAALAVAIVDAALTAGVMVETIERFLMDQKHAQAEADADLLRKVEATRVEMETF